MARKKRSRVSAESTFPSTKESSDHLAASGDSKDDGARERLSGPFVLGIGASAGGLEAFKRFLAEMPPDSGIAIVLVPHLDPTHESLLGNLLAKHTSMPVVEASDGTIVRPNHVYVIPPNKYMTISQEKLRLTGPVEKTGPQTSIDIFLRSLAEEKGERAICVILSGTGSHGTLGLGAIKASGGLTIVQDPATAKYPSMPQNAIATGIVDCILPPEKIPEALVNYVRQHALKDPRQNIKTSDAMTQILAFLRLRAKLDFRSYRRKMLSRGIERRMALCRLSSMDEYLAYLRNHSAELKRLTRDLLISVTTFFRDPEAWQVLEAMVVGPLVRSKEADSPLRVWSAGCATGEEAYSLGMLILEQLADAQKTCQVQIFASDIDDAALEKARQAVYPDSIAADVTTERLGRYFVRAGGSSYQVGKQLRELVIFAHQNLITDAPFSKLDLIVCRNLLIYLEPEAQKRVLAVLHFALNEGGYLFLGPSETIGKNIDLFEPVGAKWRIYRRLGHARINSLQFPLSESDPLQEPSALSRRSDTPQRLAEVAQKFLLKRISLACVVITRGFEVLHFAGPTEDFLTQPPGPPTHDLLALARPGLESKLRMVIQKAVRENKPQSLSDVAMMDGNTMRKVRIEVEPARWTNQTDGLLLVSFQGTGPLPSGTEAKKEIQVAESDVIRQLEQELDSTREDLQCSIEELESSNEELKASNEEVMSMNEELQSANEELETSKEELQSLNEELSTVNSQLQDKVQDLESTNNDVANLLNCTDIATIFLDSSLRIKRYTPASTQMFKLIPTDVGRPLSDVVRCFDDDRLISDAQRLLEDLSPREREVRCDADRWYLRRVLPYRTLDNQIEGVVITFIDVTERKRSADATTRRLASIVENSADAIFSIDLKWTILTWNRGAERVYGYRADEIIGKPFQILLPKMKVDEWAEAMSRVAGGEDAVRLDTERMRKDGSLFPVAITASPIMGENGRFDSISMVDRDISERRRAERELHEREERLRAILDTAVDSIISIDRAGIIQSINPAVERMFGYSEADLVGQNVKMLMPSPYREQHDDYLQRFAATGEARIIGVGREVEGLRKNGTTFPLELSVSVIDDLGLYAGILHDLSGRKQLEKQIIEIVSLQQTRIGQELHDRAGQKLTALSLLTDSLEGGGRAKNPDYDVILRSIKEGISRLHHLIRNIAFGLATNDITAEELERTLFELARRTQESFGIACTSHFEIDASCLNDFEANHLACIAIEACNNVCRHADAQSIEIVLHEVDGRIRLQITDDGGGMNLDPAMIEEGLGVGIMRQRASLIKADFRIEPGSPRGTSVVCTLRKDAHG